MKNHASEKELLVFIANQLQEQGTPLTEWQVPDSVVSHLAVLDNLAHQTNRVYSIFNFSTLNYLYCSSNLPHLVGANDIPEKSDRWHKKYITIVQDQKIISSFISVRKELHQLLPVDNRAVLGSSVCGGRVINLNNQSLRLHFHSIPLLLNNHNDVVLSFDYLEDITHLMTASDGYWMRFTADSRVCHWHSQTRKLVEKEILKPREKNLITLWKDGRSVTEISEYLHVSIQTVKNQMSSARKRLYARDNSSLVQLCYLTGILDPPF